jgi:hypothetical protein
VQRTPGTPKCVSALTTAPGAHMSRYQALSLSLAGLLHSLNLSPFTGQMHVESSQGRGKTSVSSDGRTCRPGTAQGALPKGLKFPGPWESLPGWVGGPIPHTTPRCSRLRGRKPQWSFRWLGKGNSQEGVDPISGPFTWTRTAPHLPCESGPDGSD